MSFENNMDSDEEEVIYNKRALILKSWYIKLLTEEIDGFNPILHGRRLTQQFFVCSWLHIEGKNLEYIRRNQEKIKKNNFYEIATNEVLDNKIYLPASVKGSYRYLCALFDDTCAIMNKFGPPDVFCTFTLNPSWDAIKSNLLPGETYQDRPDLCVKTFHGFFDEFMKDVLTKNILGVNEAYAYNTKYQMRGGIHIHLILWNKKNTKFDNIYFAEKVFWSTIPAYPDLSELKNLVLKFMLYGPCDNRFLENNSDLICIDNNNVCRHKFPKPNVDKSYIDEDSNIILKRSNQNLHEFKNKVVSDCDIVAYNPYILSKYQNHTNIEPCKHSSSAKYLFKYVYKNYNFVNFEVKKDDEIEQFSCARYVSGIEAANRLYGYTTSKLYLILLNDYSYTYQQ